MMMTYHYMQTPSEESEKKSKKVKKAKARPDDDLFGNTDDIFGDVPTNPTSPKPRKTKSKKSTKKSNGGKVEGVFMAFSYSIFVGNLIQTN